MGLTQSNPKRKVSNEKRRSGWENDGVDREGLRRELVVEEDH